MKPNRLRNLAVFCSGNGTNFEAILRAIQKRTLKARVALMVCDNPKAYALKRAQRHGVPICFLSPKLFKTRRSYEKVLVRILKNQKVEAVILAGFMRILSPDFVRAYRNRILNIHPAYLPAFPGTQAIRDAFEAGVQETGVTVHRVTEKVDRGPILAQRKVRVFKRDTLQSLEKRIHALEHQLYPRAIQRFLEMLGRSKKR